MIDQAIYEVYQRDKKVFIPDFGAIIYSEVTDNIDFNDLLTFDDGKVIGEIQKQEQMAEEDAKYELNEYVENIKRELNQGQLHFFKGIGYLSKDPHGVYSIQKTAPSSDLIDEDEPKDVDQEKPSKSQVETVESTFPTDDDVDQVNEKKKDEEQPVNDAPEIDLLEEPANRDRVESTPIDEVNTQEESTFSYKPILSEEDENVQDYYKRKEQFYTPPKRRNRFVTAILVVVLLSLILFIAYFFINNQDLHVPWDDQQVQQTQISNTTSLETSTNNDKEASKEVLASIDQDNDTPKNVGSAKSKDSDAKINQEASPNLKTSASRETISDQNKVYSLIMGSFKDEENADKLRQRLLKQGIDANIFRRRNSFYFVGIEDINGKANAVKRLEEVKKQQPSAWIIKKL